LIEKPIAGLGHIQGLIAMLFKATKLLLDVIDLILLLIFLAILTAITSLADFQKHHSQKRFTKATKANFKQAAHGSSNAIKCAKKPAWITDHLLRSKAWNRNASCRALAEQFNRAYAELGFSVSKSFAADLIRKRGADIVQLRARWKNNPPKEGDKNQTWAMDLSFVTDHTIKQRILLGIIDHGSRASMAFEELANKRSVTILRCLIKAMKQFGLPKKIRVDNEACFHGWPIRMALMCLNIRLQTTPPHSPWCNGRIERFFGSFKRDFERVVECNLERLVAQWRWYYNFARAHQHLSYKTPAESWSKKPKATGGNL
jgi:putative transposase